MINRRLVRLDRADAVGRRRLAAVAGEAFRLDDVVAATELDGGPRRLALDAPSRRRLATAEATAGRYHFAHALMREAVLAA